MVYPAPQYLDAIPEDYYGVVPFQPIGLPLYAYTPKHPARDLRMDTSPPPRIQFIVGAPFPNSPHPKCPHGLAHHVYNHHDRHLRHHYSSFELPRSAPVHHVERKLSPPAYTIPMPPPELKLVYPERIQPDLRSFKDFRDAVLECTAANDVFTKWKIQLSSYVLDLL